MSQSSSNSTKEKLAEGLNLAIKGISSIVFSEYPKLTSFGWKQYNNTEDEPVITIDKADIDYQDGPDLYTEEDLAKQKFIYNQLKRLNPTALTAVFDSNSEITIDADLEITRTDYDLNRAHTFEL